MKQVEILTARLNLGISINRLILRSKLERLSEDKARNIQFEANDLKYALDVFKMIEKDNEILIRTNNSLRLEIMILKKELLTKIEKPIEL
tara:strand:- start:4492 stop:4761 length:270 start_codon:yes stop_codon:yes gene_type:complete